MWKGIQRKNKQFSNHYHQYCYIQIVDIPAFLGALCVNYVQSKWFGLVSTTINFVLKHFRNLIKLEVYATLMVLLEYNHTWKTWRQAENHPDAMQCTKNCVYLNGRI